MHPAFSVIFFTTASGAGFGLFAWLGLLAMSNHLPGRVPAAVALFVGAVLATAGLFSSVAHLSQPQRAWRAFSQWRSSWLSREGIIAIITFLPALALFYAVLYGHTAAAADDALNTIPHGVVVATLAMRISGALLFLLSLGTVACTAMIYASLKPIPAWTHPLVLPVYMVFSLYSGGLLYAAVAALAGIAPSSLAAVGMMAGAALLAVLKLSAWKRIDEDRSPVSRNSALGLPHARPAQVFERPHTEANYLLKEMGYVLARRHARRLRRIAMLLFSLLPALLALPLWLLPGLGGTGILLSLALLSVLAGALVERWLFFAEARHLVTLYY